MVLQDRHGDRAVCLGSAYHSGCLNTQLGGNMTQLRYMLASTERLRERRDELKREVAEADSNSKDAAISREWIEEINKELTSRL